MNNSPAPLLHHIPASLPSWSTVLMCEFKIHGNRWGKLLFFLDSPPCFPSNLHFIEEGYQKKVFLCLLSIWITQQCLAALNPALTFAPFCFNFPPFFSSWWFFTFWKKQNRVSKENWKLVITSIKLILRMWWHFTQRSQKKVNSHPGTYQLFTFDTLSFDTKSDSPHLDSNISLFLFNVPGVIFLFWPVIISISYSF